MATRSFASDRAILPEAASDDTAEVWIPKSSPD
jgi:hypothetical protein